MEELSLYELFNLLKKTNSEIEIGKIKSLIQEKESLMEDTSATGGPSGSVGASSVGVGGGGVALANVTTAGMGGVASSTPSHFPGALTGTAWITGGGREGSGDISVPYNPSGANRVFQKISAPGLNKTRKESDPNVITKKSRVKPLNIKTLKELLKDKKPSGKVMNFSDFEKKDVTTKVTKVKEGNNFDIDNKEKRTSRDFKTFR